MSRLRAAFSQPRGGASGRIAGGNVGPWLTTQQNGGAVTPPQTGLGSELWERLCGPRTFLLGLELGTYPMTPSGGILRQDNFLHRQPGARGPDARPLPVPETLQNSARPARISSSSALSFQTSMRVILPAFSS